ncbi:helix-turn-helix transcriptional regulator [Actinoplanes sp. CA-142083]|uniref:helix-turn-helix transcriptional regulator n=1 Tax=Actinoplanes sp. CA-142083 TaxID=3239903 RepID=UPI003D938895
MTRPTARVLALLEILQGGGTHTANDLAERLGVDERTVRRYAEHLIDLEVPVASVRGRYGGYRLMPGFRMPPLMLTDEEALAVLLGLATVNQEAAEAASAKVRRVLPKALAAKLGTLFENQPREGKTPEAATMLRLAEATQQRRPAVIGYVDSKGQHTERTIHPYGLVANRGRWYVSGATGKGMRTFRLDRIENVRLTQGTFEAVLTEAAPIDVPWRYQVSVRVQGAAEVVRSRLPQGIATVEPEDKERVRVRLRAERLDWLPGVLAGLGLPFVIEEPAELRQLWADRLAAWVAQGDYGLRDQAES